MAAEPAPVRISLGGARKVEATILEGPDSFEIGVRMIGVTCFDAATNTHLNRQKARMYALQAVARHLRTKGALSVRGVTVDEARTEGKSYLLTVRVPKDGLRQVEQPMKTADAVQGPSLSLDVSTYRSLLTAKDDYVSTVQELASSLADGIPTLTDGDDKHTFFRSIADREEAGVNMFAMLRKEVASDGRLLQIEAEEVAAKIEKEERKFLERLKEQVRLFENATRKE
jgi:hypothetical protein